VVDERVEAVEWRGPDALSRTFAVTRPDDPKKAWEDFRLRSDALDGVGVMGSSRILYAEPKIEAPLETFRAARADEAIAPDFPLRRLDHLIVRHGRHPPTAAPRFDGGEDLTRTKFGLKVTLRCADPARLSLRWICDAASCVPRAFRDNPRVDKQKGWMHSLNEEVPGPYGRDWVDGKRRPDLERLLCARAEPADAGAIRRYKWKDFYCARRTPLAADAAALGDLARDLLAELDLVLAVGCEGDACAPRIDRLRATARRLRDAKSLRFQGGRGRFDIGDREDPLWPESLGWSARLGQGAAGVEIACASHNDIDSDGQPPHLQCRLSVLDQGKPLAHYYPHWCQHVELPDRSAVHLQGSAENGAGELGGQIVIIGSALATSAP